MAQHQAKDASKHPSKAGETSGDSSDKLSKISEMYRAPGAATVTKKWSLTLVLSLPKKVP